MAYKRLVAPRGWSVDDFYSGFPLNGDNSAFEAGWMKWKLPSGLKEIYILAKLQRDSFNYLPMPYTDSDKSMRWTNDSSNLMRDSNAIITLRSPINMNNPIIAYEHFKSDSSSGLAEVKIQADNVNASYCGNVLGGNDITEIHFGDSDSDYRTWMYWMIISDEPISLTEQVAIVTPTITNNGWTAATDGSGAYTTSEAGSTLTLTAPDDASGMSFNSMQAYAADATGGTLTTLKIGDKSFALTSAGASYNGDATTEKSITITAES